MEKEQRNRRLEKHTAKLVTNFPLTRGEQIVERAVASFVNRSEVSIDELTEDDFFSEWMINDEDTIALCRTKNRFGVWRGKWFSRPRFLQPIESIAGIELLRKHRLVTFRMVDGGVISVRLFSNDEMKSFVDPLIQARSERIGASTSEPLATAFQRLDSGVESLSLIDQAIKAESFHPGPLYLKATVLAAIGQGNKAADMLLAAAERQPLCFGATPPTIWLNVNLPKAHLCQLSEMLHLDKPDQKLMPWQMLFAALVGARSGDWARCIQLAHSAVERSASSSRPQFEVWARQLLVGHSSLLDLCPAAEKWFAGNEPGLSSEDCNTPITGGGIECGFASGPAFHKLLEATELRASNLRKAQVVWECVRAGEYQVALKQLGIAPLEYVKRLVGASYPGDPRFLRGGLASIEMLLHSSMHAEARQAIDVVRSATASFVTDSDEPLLANSPLTFGLYRSLAEKDANNVRLFQSMLRKHDGFEWIGSAIKSLLPEAAKAPPTVVAAGADLEHFARWAKSTVRHTSLRGNRSIEQALSAFEKARADTALRVVVGGETSSGKSTFLNRLLHCDVLHTARAEATAVGTHLRQSDEWKVTVKFSNGRPSLVQSFDPSNDAATQVREFVARFTSVSSTDSRDVSRVEIYGQLESLGDDVELIDSPGLNAHMLRTERADAILDEAHACIFVIDARNALKAGEMRKIVVGQELVGRMIFVINKTDLIQPDDDLDVDADPLGDLISRVRSELAASCGSEEVTIFAVSSLASSDESAFQEILDRLNEILGTSKDQLIKRRAGRLAATVAQESVNGATAALTDCGGRLAQLSRVLPDHPAAFRQFLEPRVVAKWDQHKDAYRKGVEKAVRSAGSRLRSRVKKAIKDNDNLESLAGYLRRNFRSQVNDLFNDTATARNREWDQFARLALSDITAFFRAQYDGIDCQPTIDIQTALEKATPMPLPGVHGLISEVETKIQSANSQIPTGAVIAGTIGFFLGGPAGAAIGAGIGGAAGLQGYADACEEIESMINSRVEDFIGEVSTVVDRDIQRATAGKKHPKILEGILGFIDRERKILESRVKEQITATTTQLERIEKESEQLRKIAGEAFGWAQRLQTGIPSANVKAQSIG